MRSGSGRSGVRWRGVNDEKAIRESNKEEERSKRARKQQRDTEGWRKVAERGRSVVILLERRRSGWRFGAVTLKGFSSLAFEICYNMP